MKTTSIYYDFCLFSYFDIPDYKQGMSVNAWIRQVLNDETIRAFCMQDIFYKKYYEALQQSVYERYRNFYICEYWNDNQNSGVVAYVIRHNDRQFVVFRGSEIYDNVNHLTKWQDWKDNVEMFLEVPTMQQLYAKRFVDELHLTGEIELCGHSKGGNLACFVYLCASDSLDDQIGRVVALNAPGFPKKILDAYQIRIKSEPFQERLLLVESENDCVSECFVPLLEPVIVKSAYPLHNLVSFFHCHNVYGYALQNGKFMETTKKHHLCDGFGYMVNSIIAKQKPELLKTIVKKMNSYFDSDMSLKELYHVLVYHLGCDFHVFETLSYEEIKLLEFSTLRKLLLEEYFQKAKEWKMHVPTKAMVQDLFHSAVNHIYKKELDEDGQIDTGKEDH